MVRDHTDSCSLWQCKTFCIRMFYLAKIDWQWRKRHILTLNIPSIQKTSNQSINEFLKFNLSVPPPDEPPG